MRVAGGAGLEGKQQEQEIIFQNRIWEQEQEGAEGAIHFPALLSPKLP